MQSSKMALENSESFFLGMFARNETVFISEKSRTTNDIPTLPLGMPPDLLTIELHFWFSVLLHVSLDASLQLCLHVSHHLLHSYCIMFFLKLCVSSLHLVFLHAVAISLHQEKTSPVPLMLSLFVPSFFLSFFLAFFLSFFHCLEFMPA